MLCYVVMNSTLWFSSTNMNDYGCAQMSPGMIELYIHLIRAILLTTNNTILVVIATGHITKICASVH